MAKRIIPVRDKHMVSDQIGSWVVLWTIREKGPLTFSKLYEFVYGYPEYYPSQISFLTGALSRLGSMGLIRTSKEIDFHYLGGLVPAEIHKDVVIKLTPLVDQLQAKLGISITSYAEGKGERIGINPVLGEPNSWKKGSWPDVFVLMPFTQELRLVYEDHILKVTKKLSISCERCDDFFSAESIVNEIWTAIFESKVCIADCTGRNPNVFYELGMSHTLGRPTILISQSVDDVPFDIRHRRFILYEFTPRGMKEFEEKLQNTLENELRNTNEER